ncbi:zinc finger domain-containing protein [Streptomyces sp. enrichment culture]|uniref:zinc finger domain-containing protein n=1 Tax=Streptomyces sp. enrichment culture TaxID=1795815 RepID=UPI003F542C5A
MEYFTLVAKKPMSHEPGAVEAALRQAWNACAETACPKCYVPAGQYCRNRTADGTWVTRFHRPRQDAADVPQILPSVGIHGLSWATGKGGFRWDDRRVPTV